MIRRALGGCAAAAGVAAYFDDEWRRSIVIGLGGLSSRLFIRSTNNLRLHDAHHLEQGLQRPAGTGLLSVSNHISTVDDPHLLASIVPLRTLFYGASEMRWGVCADDVCFRPGTKLSKLADASKVLPVRRGAGIWQAELDGIADKLRDGHWVHYFPEGKIRQDGRVHPFRRGVGRIIGSIEEPSNLTVLPFYHMGNDKLQPTTPTSTSIFVRPNTGQEIHVIFGEPVDLSRFLKLRSCPPFDRRPELLYECIAHTLEEEVRALRATLHRRLGIAPHIPREGGAFGESGDRVSLHPDYEVERARAGSERPPDR